MTLLRVNTANTTIPETQESQFVLLSALGSDNKPYAISIDESTGQLPVSLSGATATLVKETYSFKYSSINVTTSAWVQIIASTSAIIKEWDIFSGTGEVIEIGTGTVGNEVRFALIGPGGATFSHQIASGSRIALRAVTGTANAGDFSMNAWG